MLATHPIISTPFLSPVLIPFLVVYIIMYRLIAADREKAAKIGSFCPQCTAPCYVRLHRRGSTVSATTVPSTRYGVWWVPPYSSSTSSTGTYQHCAVHKLP